ncbi:hypothetical protein FDECE_9812 [Fusarium decemcellulare]|nr:hypothetical protein FDECE_9812 [Fusarium decemcellulare]
MASSDPFRSSPLQGPRREVLHIESSSPGLPPLQDVLSQKPSRPAIRSGSRAAPIPDHMPPSFVSARHLLAVTETTQETAPESSTGRNRAVPELGAPDTPTAHAPSPAQVGDDEIVIVQITGKSSRKPRKPKPQKAPVPKRAKSKQDTSEAPNVGIDDGDSLPSKAGDEIGTKEVQAKPKTAKPRRKKTGTTSNHFPPVTGPELPPESKNDAQEPLHLEQAPARRLDWTPPAQKTIINVDSDSSTFKQLASSEAGQPLPVFKNLVEGYACLEATSEATLQTLTVTSDEDSSFLRKRKLIELVTTKETTPPSAVPDKSPKKKAPKKKPRTITELATAAYKVPTQPDLDPPTPSILDHFQSTGNKADAPANEQTSNAKNKGKQKKRASKVSKKKAAPPKPILLSPGTALAQVANQDFVFGTSSQLAREESPTVLRDIQAALRQSNQGNDIDFVTPVNSDAIEPPEQQTSLWNAAARDADGDLFDLEVINLTEDSPRVQAGADADPFGYFVGEDQEPIPTREVGILPSDGHDSFASLPDILPSARRTSERQEHHEESPFFSDSDISICTNLHQSAPKQTKTKTAQSHLPPASNPLPEATHQPGPPPPNYETYTDVQLAREIRTFGFKPIKRRSAMIALLDQCWQSKVRMGQVSVHTSAKLSSVTSIPTKITSSAPAGVITKKLRGRPRKNSPSASEPQEPPPSAQPQETPKRPRGRPRKDSLASSSGIASPTKCKAAASLKKTTIPPKSPQRRKRTTKPILEIPDSASDFGSDLTSSPDSSIAQMFSSPPPLDLSLSTGDDTELSLTASQNDHETTLFEHITKAIQSAPRTDDPMEPSWHEKILLYDPIVLEDLTAWLNTGELSRVGYDEEVNPNDVKKWCESKSVCCLWRVNLRGKERKRF